MTRLLFYFLLTTLLVACSQGNKERKTRAFEEDTNWLASLEPRVLEDIVRTEKDKFPIINRHSIESGNFSVEKVPPSQVLPYGLYYAEVTTGDDPIFLPSTYFHVDKDRRVKVIVAGDFETLNLLIDPKSLQKVNDLEDELKQLQAILTAPWGPFVLPLYEELPKSIHEIQADSAGFVMKTFTATWDTQDSKVPTQVVILTGDFVNGITGFEIRPIPEDQSSSEN